MTIMALGRNSLIFVCFIFTTTTLAQKSVAESDNTTTTSTTVSVALTSPATPLPSAIFNNDTTETAFDVTTSPAIVFPKDPEFYAVSPQQGPWQGGTTLTFNASIPLQLFPVNIQLSQWNSSSDVVVNRSISSFDRYARLFTAVTPPVQATLANVTLRIGVLLNDSQLYWTNFTFTYRSGPVVTSISPHQYVYTGGTQLSVHGSAFDIVESPTLLLTTTTKLSSGQQNIGHYSKECNATNSTFMVCVLPTITAPSAIVDYMNVLNVGRLVNGSVDFTQGDRELYSNRTVVDDGLGNTMKVEVGFQFDDNLEYVNLTSALGSSAGWMVLVPPPYVPFHEAPYNLTKDSNIISLNVSGRHLDYGCDKSNYKVQFESSFFLVDRLAATSFTFTVPSLKDVVKNGTNFDFQCPHSTSSYRVQVFLPNIKYSVGCVSVHSPCNSNPCQHNGTCIDLDTAGLYQCDCSPDYYGSRCESVYPTVQDVKPLRGPVAGGTIITITGNIPISHFTALGVYLGDFLFIPIKHGNASQLVVETVSVSSAAYDLPVLISFQWTGNSTTLNRTTGRNFTYADNPNITDIYPIEHLYTGGTILQVTGSSMDASVSPVITITMLVTVIPTNKPYHTAQFEAFCVDDINNESMSCRIPVIDVPSEILPILDTDNYIPSPPFGDYDPTPVNVTCLPDYPESPSDAGSRFKVEFGVGFRFDGFVGYKDYDALVVYAPPLLCSDVRLTWESRINHSVSIQGRHLLRGCLAEDYQVLVEDTPGTVVALSNDTLTFLPRNFSAADPPTTFCAPGFEFHVYVYVGNKLYSVGCIHYNHTADNYCGFTNCQHNTTCSNTAHGAYCDCTPTNYYGQLCEKLRPQLDSLTPSYGPVQGGTLVTIHGLLTAAKPTSVYFGADNQSTNIISSDNVSAVAMTPRVSLVGVVTISLIFDDGHVENVTQLFTFKPNPNVTAIQPRDQNRRDGSRITIIGQNLDSCAQPNMTVVTVVQRQTSQLSVVTTTTPFDTSACSVESSSSVVCLMPVVSVPDDFVQFLDLRTVNSTTSASVSTNSRQSTGRQRRAVESITQGGSTLTVYVTLRFDGFNVTSDALADGGLTILLHNPPTITPLPSHVAFYPNKDQIVEVQGNNLTVGCTRDDFQVLIGGGQECQLVDVFNNRVQFRPPDNITAQENDTTSTACTDDMIVQNDPVYEITIMIGSTPYPAGCVEYMMVDEKAQHQELIQRLLYYVGASVGGAVVVVIVIACFTRSSSTK